MQEEEEDAFRKLGLKGVTAIAAAGLVSGNVGAAVLNMFGALERDICEFGVPLGQIGVIAKVRNPEMIEDDPEEVTLEFHIDAEATWCGVPDVLRRMVLNRVNEVWGFFIKQVDEILDDQGQPTDWGIRFNRFKLGFAAAAYIRSWGRHFGDGRCGPVNQSKAPEVDLWQTMTNENELRNIFKGDPRLKEFIHFNLHDEWIDED